MSVSIIDYEEIVKKMTNEVIEQIEKEIQNEIIDVPQHKTIIPTMQKQKTKPKPKKKKHHKTQQPIPTLDHLRQIKQSKLMELREIEKQQDELKKSAIMNNSKVSASCSKLKRSNFTEEEMIEIKKIIHNQNKFEKELMKKEADLENWLKLQRHEEEEMRKQDMAQQCEQRKKELKKQREEFQKRKHEQKIQFEQQIKRIQQVKAKKWLHQKLTESWKKYEQITQLQKQKIWEQQKQRRKINSKAIKDHELKYLQMKKQQEKKREQALEHSRTQKHHLPYIHSSIFYKVQKEQEEKNRMEQIKSHEKEDNVVKKKLYSKQIKELFLPKVKSSAHTSTDRIDQKISPHMRTLNIEESYKLGNDYMKNAHQRVTSQLIEKLKNSLNVLEEPGGHSIHYKNYLKDLKAEHLKQNKQSTLQIVESTLRNKHLSSTDKLHKVKMAFEKDRGIKKSDTQLIDTIKTKMKVLQEIGN